MGMAASQVRFLTLQDRKSSIGMRLGVLSNRKMALARDMNRAAKAYNDAYSETKLQWYDSIDGTYEDITYEALMTPQTQNSFRPYILTDRNTGKVILDGAYGKETSGILGYGGPSAESNEFWGDYSQYKDFLPHSPSGSIAVSGTMPYHMERLTGIATDRYMPGTVSFVEDKMAPYIIEQIMGIPNFDRNKKVYEAVENTTLRDGGYEKFVHSDILSMLNQTVSASAVNKTTSLIPVWEFKNDQNNNKWTYHRALDIISGKYIDTPINSQGKIATEWMSDTSVGWQVFIGVITGGLSAFSHVDDEDTDGYMDALQEVANTHAYVDSFGNSHYLNDNIYWSTLYKDNAVVFIKRDFGISEDNPNDDDYGYQSINYTNDIANAICGTNGGSYSQALYQWAHGFADAANKSGMFRYKMDEYLDYIAQATARTLRDSWSADYDWGTGKKNNGKANVDTYLDNIITSNFADFDDQFNNNGNIDLADFKKNVADQMEYSVYASDTRSAVGQGSENGTNNILLAAAQEANETISPIIIEAAHFQVNNNGTNFVDSDGYGSDRSVAFSVKNMMDVALYYIGMVQDKLAKTNGAAGTITSADDLYDIARSEFGSEEYNAGYNRDYTNPENFSQGEIEVFQQGETRVASVYSILSNLEMLKEKTEYCRSLDGTEASQVHYLGNEGEDNFYGFFKDQLNDFINGDKEITDAYLMELANVNEWMCKALKQDYTTAEDVTKLNEYIDNAWDAFCLHWYGGYTENTWEEQQAGQFGNGYAYDSNTRWNRRTQLFSQDSEAKKATSHIDVEGQLTALQFHQYKFYVNLITECLARGWKDQSDNAGYSDIDPESVTLHLQNGTWLINDTMAKSSSRVFEVTNIEAREEALSKYEMLQADLKVKEQDVDMEMKRLITEQNSVNAEMECLQNIISENIKETFKVFNA
ncbi:hypothetical protein IJI31_02600 [bacterium]|nr:hypothetical protein [bacterium]